MFKEQKKMSYGIFAILGISFVFLWIIGSKIISPVNIVILVDLLDYNLINGFQKCPI